MTTKITVDCTFFIKAKNLKTTEGKEDLEEEIPRFSIKYDPFTFILRELDLIHQELKEFKENVNTTISEINRM